MTQNIIQLLKGVGLRASTYYTLNFQPLFIYLSLHIPYMETYLRINQEKAKIIKKLKKGGKTIKNIYWDIGLTWHNCQYHLKTLESMGLVKGEKGDKTTIWILTEKGHEVLQYYE
jgi:predicted transcriptional regulator